MSDAVIVELIAGGIALYLGIKSARVGDQNSEVDAWKEVRELNKELKKANEEIIDLKAMVYQATDLDELKKEVEKLDDD